MPASSASGSPSRCSAPTTTAACRASGAATRSTTRARPTQKTLVIEDGRLTSYLYDRLRAERDGVASTGNGRRESFRHLPIPRMTNTYIAPGDAEPEEIIAEVESGFYAVSFAGGQVDPATGDFVFGVSEGYLIEGGKVTGPCRGATLIGNCLEALAAIDAVGNDFWMKTGICGKGGQRVPVGTGQGHVRIARDDGRGDRGLMSSWPSSASARVDGGARRRGRRRRGLRRRGRRRARSGSTAARSRASPRRRERGLGVRAWIGHRVGYAYGTDLAEAGARGDRRRRRRGGARSPTRTSSPPRRRPGRGCRDRRPRATPRRRVDDGARSSSSRSRSSAPRCEADPRVAASSRRSTPTPPSGSRSPPRPGIAGEYRVLQLPTPTCRRSPRATAVARPASASASPAAPPALDPAAIGARGRRAGHGDDRRRASPPRAPARSSSTRPSPPASSA